MIAPICTNYNLMILSVLEYYNKMNKMFLVYPLTFPTKFTVKPRMINISVFVQYILVIPSICVKIMFKLKELACKS